MALVFARSGLGIRQGVCLANGVGVIDSDYRGEIGVGLVNLGGSPYTVRPGDRIAQLIIQPCVVPTTHHILHPEDGQNFIIAMEAIKFVEVDELSKTARGCQGYGSTGR